MVPKISETQNGLKVVQLKEENSGLSTGYVRQQVQGKPFPKSDHKKTSEQWSQSDYENFWNQIDLLRRSHRELLSNVEIQYDEMAVLSKIDNDMDNSRYNDILQKLFDEDDVLSTETCHKLQDEVLSTEQTYDSPDKCRRQQVPHDIAIQNNTSNLVEACKQ